MNADLYIFFNLHNFCNWGWHKKTIVNLLFFVSIWHSVWWRPQMKCDVGSLSLDLSSLTQIAIKSYKSMILCIIFWYSTCADLAWPGGGVSILWFLQIKIVQICLVGGSLNLLFTFLWKYAIFLFGKLPLDSWLNIVAKGLIYLGDLKKRILTLFMGIG